MSDGLDFLRKETGGKGGQLQDVDSGSEIFQEPLLEKLLVGCEIRMRVLDDLRLCLQVVLPWILGSEKQFSRESAKPFGFAVDQLQVLKPQTWG